MGGFLIFGLIIGSILLQRPSTVYPGQRDFSMGHIVLIFGLPMLIASWLISPTVLEIHHLLRAFWMIVILAAIFPFAGWPALIALATAFAANPEFTGQSRAEFLLKAWLGGAVLTVLIIIWFLSIGDTHPGLNPTLGYAVGGFDIVMLVSCGFWGAFSHIIGPEIAIKGALVTGVALFCVVGGLAYLVYADNRCTTCEYENVIENGMPYIPYDSVEANRCHQHNGKYVEQDKRVGWTCVSSFNYSSDPGRANRIADFARATHLNLDDARLCESRGGQYMVEGGNDHFTCVSRQQIPLR